MPHHPRLRLLLDLALWFLSIITGRDFTDRR